MQKKRIRDYVWHYFLLLLGSFLLSFGNAVFLTKLEIVPGGLAGVGIIIQSFITKSGSTFQAVDIVVWAFSAFFWILSLIFIGKKFALRTLVASVASPLFLTLLLRVMIPNISFLNAFQNQVSGDGSVGYLILCGLFGGLCVGAGVSVTFVAGGSTGGVDVIVFLMSKYLHIKESWGSIIVDGVIIVTGMFCMQKYVAALCGILCVTVSSFLIEIIYVKRQSSCQADIISDKYEEISRFVQDELGRGATIITANGGYKGDPRPMLRVVIDKTQYGKLKDFLAEIDPTAFVTFTITKAVYGEGFTKNNESIITKKVKGRSKKN